MGQPPPLEFRRAEPDDTSACVAVAARALGWDPGEPHAAFFRWKHLDNPAGPSPVWVAVAGDRVVGFRAMLRWRFVGPGPSTGQPMGGRTPAREPSGQGVAVAAVRAVDTATDPDHRRRGIFRSLTLTAVEELTVEGVAFVFNTPNASSRAGYLTMGWVDAGHLGARIRVAGPAAVVRLTRARVPARKWSEPLAIGDPIELVAADLAGRIDPVDGLRTRRDTDHLVWRYGFGPLAYRVVSDDGAAAVVRLRRRGPARELVLAELVADSGRAARRLLRRLPTMTGADHLLTLRGAPHPVSGTVPVPRLGPVLTLRGLAAPPPNPAELRLSLGDVELF